MKYPIISFRQAIQMLIAALACWGVQGCTGKSDFKSDFKNEKNVNFDKVLVVNEVMADNHTGRLDASGELTEWIEIKNVSDGDVALREYSLAAIKKANKKDSTANEWKAKEFTMPDTTLAAGKCLVVEVKKAKKKGKKEDDGDEANSRKLPKKDGWIAILASDGTTMAEMKYDQLGRDLAIRRLEDGTTQKTYEQSPGFDNNEDGYEAYMALIDGQRKSDLQIWEVKPSGDAASAQWVEVKNVGKQAINLKEYCLTNNADKPNRWSFPDKQLAPGELFVVPTVGKKASANNPNKANFKLGEDASVLLTRNKKFVDGVSAKGAYIGTSVGHVTGKKGFFFFNAPSYGAENTGKAFRYMTARPTLDQKPGVYADKKSLSVNFNNKGGKVHYTLNGTMPTMNSQVFDQPITMEKSTTIRYFSEGDDNHMRSAVGTSTYLLGEKHTIGVVNITVAESDLYDYHTGIYVEGPNPHQEPADDAPNNWEQIRNANYMQHWVKRAHLEFFDEKGGFSADCGLRIFGAGSRALEKKSFAIKLDPQFGPSSVTYDFFGTGETLKLEDFVLRSGSTDAIGVMARDEFFTSLMGAESPTLLVQDYRPVALYINTKYFGLYYIREKVDKNFVARKLNVSNDAITILRSQYAEDGTATEFNNLMQYFRSHDMKQKEAFEYAKQHIEFTSLIDQKMGEMYSTNTDIYNVRQVKSDDEGCSKKWYWVLYDLDDSWIVTKSPGFYLREGFNVGIGSQPVAFNNAMIDRLLANQEFRELFLERLSHHMHTTFEPKHARAVFDGIVNKIQPEMERNCKRWPQMMSYESWLSRVDEFRQRIATRQMQLLNALRKELSITPDEDKKYFSGL